MSLQRSTQLLRPLSRSRAHSPSLLLPSPTILATSDITKFSATRYYTRTTPHQANPIRKAPVAKVVSKGYGKVRPKSVSPEEWLRSHNEVKSRLERSYRAILADVLTYDMIESKFTPKLFLEIGRRLVDQAYNVSPSADALKSIWKGDPAMVYQVANAIWLTGPWETQVLTWAETATSEAGFVFALARKVRRQVLQRRGHLTASREIEIIKKIAYEKEDPMALVVWAEVARIWGHTEEALDIYTHLNNMVYPSHRQPPLFDDILLRGHYKAPWSILVEMYNEAERYQEADELTKIGALEYRDPEALVTYAFSQRQEGDWVVYEKCLVAAAMSGHAESCFRLGNYYYRVSKGEIPSRDDIVAQKHRVRGWLAKKFGWNMSKKDWRHLAANWYEVSSAFGHIQATRNLAVLGREDGHPGAFELLSRLRADTAMWNNKNIVKLRSKWDDPSFKPTLPDSWLEL